MFLQCNIKTKIEIGSYEQKIASSRIIISFCDYLHSPSFSLSFLFIHACSKIILNCNYYMKCISLSFYCFSCTRMNYVKKRERKRRVERKKRRRIVSVSEAINFPYEKFQRVKLFSIKIFFLLY